MSSCLSRNSIRLFRRSGDVITGRHVAEHGDVPGNLILAQTGAPSGELARASTGDNGASATDVKVWPDDRLTRSGRPDFDLGWPAQTKRFKNSSRAPIAIMQTADLRNRDYLSFRWMLDSMWHRFITFQRKMSA